MHIKSGVSMKERYLVGRRYEDYIRHGIDIRLTEEEVFWRSVYLDTRLQPLIDRRKEIRRQSDQGQVNLFVWLHPQCSFTYLDQLDASTP
jgi:hypothetical protein